MTTFEKGKSLWLWPDGSWREDRPAPFAGDWPNIRIVRVDREAGTITFEPIPEAEDEGAA